MNVTQTSPRDVTEEKEEKEEEEEDSGRLNNSTNDHRHLETQSIKRLGFLSAMVH